MAGYFATEKKELMKSYYHSDKTGKFESWFPPSYYEPREDLHYGGNVAVTVGPACASACEEMAYVFSQLPDVQIVGMYPSGAALGEVARGQYSLPDGWSYQIPDGYVTDMEGNIIVEGVGVVPTVQVPITVETIQAIFVDGTDVILDAAVAAIMPQE
jgi:C-terminal processing protease CtpA/Prc